MNVVLIIFLSPIFELLKILPKPFIRFIAKGLAFALYRIFKYRVTVVYTNLKIAFPEKSEKERKKIAYKFYNYFAFYGLSLFSDSQRTYNNLKKKCRAEHIHLLEEKVIYKESILLLTGHFGYWEYLGIHHNVFNLPYLYIIYKEFKSKYFTDLLHNIRHSKTEGISVKDTAAFRTIFKAIKTHNRSSMFTILSDQAPDPKNAHWVNFFGVKTPFFRGPEELARKLNLTALFFHINLEKENTYVLHTKNMDYDINLEGSFTQAYATELEAVIRQNPELWFWSHKRWKHNNIKY